MENHGIIIRELRHLKSWSVQFTSKKINRSVGWISAIENNSGNCRLTEAEFNRIVTALDGDRHRSMFRTWVANCKNRERAERSFDGAVLKFIRRKKEINLVKASKLTSLSVRYLSERGCPRFRWDS